MQWLLFDDGDFAEGARTFASEQAILGLFLGTFGGCLLCFGLISGVCDRVRLLP